jgi:hypothetical protein
MKKRLVVIFSLVATFAMAQEKERKPLRIKDDMVKEAVKESNDTLLQASASGIKRKESSVKFAKAKRSIQSDSTMKFKRKANLKVTNNKQAN